MHFFQEDIFKDDKGHIHHWFQKDTQDRICLHIIGDYIDGNKSRIYGSATGN